MNPKMIPGLAVNEGLDFVKKVWGSLPIPSVITPTTDVEELDKRISDLRAVEQWLNVNLSMLRATIQGLEVQRGTIATLKQFGNNLGVGKPVTKAEEKTAGSGFSDALGNLGAGLVGAVGAIAAGQSGAAAAAQAAGLAGGSMPSSAMPAAAPGMPAGAPASGASADSASPSDEAVANALIANASNWWGVLQDQFNRVAGAAMSGAGLAAAAGEQAASAVKPKTKRTVSAAKATKPARASSAIVSKTTGASSGKSSAAKTAKPASRSRKT